MIMWSLAYREFHAITSVLLHIEGVDPNVLAVFKTLLFDKS